MKLAIVLVAALAFGSQAGSNTNSAPEGVARAFVDARVSGSTSRIMAALDPDLVATLIQLLRDVHATDPASTFSHNLNSLGETDQAAPLLTMLFGPQRQAFARAEPVVEIVGQVNQGPDRALVVVRIKQFVSHFPEPLALSELSAVSVVRRPSGWFVAAPGGDADVQKLRDMVTGGLLASRDGGLVETVDMSAPASPGSVTIASLDPPPNSILTRTSTITAELDYRVDRFEPGRFQASARVAEIQPGMSTMGTGAHFEEPVLATAQGRVRFVYPALAVWDDPKVKRPFEISFCIQQLVGRVGMSQTVACTKPTIYRTSAESVGASRTLARLPFDVVKRLPSQQSGSTSSTTNTPESVATAFLKAAAGDPSLCGPLLDPEPVNHFRDGFKKLIETAPPSVAGRLKAWPDSELVGFVIVLAMSSSADATGNILETVGTVNESPDVVFVLYQRSSADPAHSKDLPITRLGALRLVRHDGSWRVSTPSGSADVTTFLASMAMVTALAAQVEKVNPPPPSTNDARTAPPSAAETAVRAAATEWRQARISRDVMALDRLMTPDFVEVTTTGDRVNRARLLALYQSADLNVASIEVEQLAVEISGDRARVTGVRNEAVKSQGRDVGGRIAFTEIYVNTGGRWQIEWSQLRSLPTMP